MDALTEEKLKNIDEKIDTLVDSFKHVVTVIEEVRDLETNNASQVEVIQKKLTEYDQILWNGGKNGLVIRVDRLEGKLDSVKRTIEEYKKSKSERLAYVIAIASIIVSIVTAIWGR
jgi:septation ring formation regulator EzrA